jgi:PAS domain S-box-containing protein
MGRRVDDSVKPAAINPAALFDALADAYVILDRACRIVFVNRQYVRLTGLSFETIEGRSIFEINQYGGEDQCQARNEWVRALLDGLLPGETRTSTHFRGLWPSDDVHKLTPRYWKLKASIITPEDGMPCIALRVSDVTDKVARNESERREKARLRSQAQLRQILAAEKEEQLKRSREQFTEVLAFAKVGAWQRDLDSGVITCTDQCKANFGLAASENLTTERIFDELIDPCDRERVRDAVNAAIEGRGDYRTEYRVIWPDGSRHWVMVGGRAQYDERHRPTHMLGFVLNITARKEQEIEQHRIAGDERLARERSDANTLAMDHFLTAVSHELRSPIGVILNWSEMLERAGDKVGLARATTVIQRNAKQLALMVDDLLDSGAIVSGKLSISFARLALHEIVTDVVNDLRPQAGHKGLALSCDALEPCHIQGDAARVKQIVWNLLSNAVKFTDTGSVKVSVSRKGNEVLLCVSDTGTGIAPEAMARIFDRFEQLRPMSSGRVGGLGLGLWLVRTLVERHHGRIEAHSAGRGHGTTFRVFLPSSD